MAVLIIGLAIFLGVHSIALAAPGFRSDRQRAAGRGGLEGAVRARVGRRLRADRVRLRISLANRPWCCTRRPRWLRHVTFLLMLPVFPLLIAAYLPGRIKTAMKHPMLAAVKFWAFAHLALERYARGRAAVRRISGVGGASTESRSSAGCRPCHACRAGRFNDLIAVVLGLALYVLFIAWAHARLFGVSPLG